MKRLIINCFTLVIQQRTFSQFLFFESSEVSFGAKAMMSAGPKIDSFKICLKNKGVNPLLFESTHGKPFLFAVLYPDHTINITTHPSQSPSQFDDRGFTKDQKVEIFRLAPGDSAEITIPLVTSFYYQNTDLEIHEYHAYKKEIIIFFLPISDEKLSSKMAYMDLNSFRSKMNSLRFFIQ